MTAVPPPAGQAGAGQAEASPAESGDEIPAPVAGEVLEALAELAGQFRSGLTGEAGEPAVLSRRGDRLIVRVGDVVLKVHPADADPGRLAARLCLAGRPDLGDVLLAPLVHPDSGPPARVGLPGAEQLATRVGDHWVSAWPVGGALGPEQADDAPWAAAATLLARLHRAPVGPHLSAEPGSLVHAGPPGRADSPVAPASSGTSPLPPAVVLRRLRPMVARLRDHPDHPLAAVVLAAHASLVPPSRLEPVRAGRPVTIIHGDWHFGQLVAMPEQGWRVIDVDDLGLGDPAWDLARPAAWFAAGLLPVETWGRFVEAYRAAGGPALPAGDDPWTVLDLPARALTVEYAATAVVALLAAADDDTSGDGEAVAPGPVVHAFLTCCRRMAGLDPSASR